MQGKIPPKNSRGKFQSSLYIIALLKTICLFYKSKKHRWRGLSSDISQ